MLCEGGSEIGERREGKRRECEGEKRGKYRKVRRCCCGGGAEKRSVLAFSQCATFQVAFLGMRKDGDTPCKITEDMVKSRHKKEQVPEGDRNEMHFIESINHAYM